MDPSLLATLKEKLADATDFTDVWTYFFDHFGEDPEFINAGARGEHPFLASIIAQIGAELFGRKVRVENLLLTHLPDHAFYHGGFTVANRLGNVIYFDDVQTGLLAVIMSPASNETKFVRFTGRRMLRSGPPSRN
jgi:hypothetical protein